MSIHADKLFEQGQYLEVRRLYQQRLQAQPNDLHALFMLGRANGELGQFAAMSQCLNRVIQLQPAHAAAHYWLAKALVYSAQLDQAIEQLKRLLNVDRHHTDGWNLLGELYQQREALNEAHQCYQHAANSAPLEAASYVNLGSLFNDAGAFDEAQTNYDKAFELQPDVLSAALGHHLLQPVIAKSSDDIALSRQRYITGLDYLLEHQSDYKSVANLLEQLQWGYGFYLAYQGLDDRDVQEAWARFLVPLIKHVLPDQFKPLPPRRPKDKGAGKIRIAYATHFFYEHTVSQYFKKWIDCANRDEFEVYVYWLEGWPDPAGDALAAECDQFRCLNGSVGDMAKVIRNNQIDILIYPEVGMDLKTRWLAGLRLAPVQCSAWGHPVTTGLSTIDYYLSSGATEPDNADEHYSETLVRLEGLGMNCAPRRAPDAGDRKRLNLPEDRILFLCAQSLFKIHPDTDRLLAEICAQQSDALIVFFDNKMAPVVKSFKARMKAAFDTAAADFERQTQFLPRVGMDDYLRVNVLCTAMMDTPHWSGGMTSLDALANGLPIVTLEGDLSRGRQTSAMYQQMGFTDLIADDEDDYIALALRLGRDAAFRQYCAEQIQRRSEGTVFNNLEGIRSLENFYRSVCPLEA
ncbi:MAG TPA: hypothetical protein EYN73_00495 [Chromatiaceae bacterium]|nr:hypothetical protein [Chromatiaceae bacterium]